MSMENPFMSTPSASEREEGAVVPARGPEDEPQNLEAASVDGQPAQETASPQENDPREFLRQLIESRNSNEEIDVEVERDRVKDRLEKLGEALHAHGATPEKQEEIKKVRGELEEEKKKLDVAEEFNEVLSGFSELDEDELNAIAETGLGKDGKQIEHKGKHINTKIAKELASLASGGVKRLTWGALKTVFSLVDAILNDVFYPIKKILHIPG